MYIPINWHTGWAKKNLNKIFTYDSDYVTVIIRILFNLLDALWLWHWGKKFVIVVYFKMALRDTIEWQFLHFFMQHKKWERSQTGLLFLWRNIYISEGTLILFNFELRNILVLQLQMNWTSSRSCIMPQSMFHELVPLHLPRCWQNL